MSGKKAKLERKAVRAAGGEDKVTRKLRVLHERMLAEEAAQKARAEKMANETAEERAERLRADSAAMLRMTNLMGVALALGVGSVINLPPIVRSQYQRRGR